MNGLCVQNKNKITHNKNGFNEMKKQTTKRAYVKPQSEIYKMQIEHFICISVTPNASASSSSTPWDAEEEHDGGTFYLGDPISPGAAKAAKTIWEEE